MSAITAIASGSVDPAEASTTPVEDLSAGVNPGLVQPPFQRREQQRGRAEHLRLADAQPRQPARSRRTAGMSDLAWKARVSSSGRATTSRTPSAASDSSTPGTDGMLKSRKPVSTRSPGRSDRTRAHEGVHGRRVPRVAAAVGDDEKDRVRGTWDVSSSPAGRGCAAPAAPAG